jgi:hypothetical protein
MLAEIRTVNERLTLSWGDVIAGVFHPTVNMAAALLSCDHGVFHQPNVRG